MELIAQTAEKSVAKRSTAQPKSQPLIATDLVTRTTLSSFAGDNCHAAEV